MQSFLRSNYEQARRHLERELELADALGDSSGLVHAMFWLARRAIFQGQAEEAERWLRKLNPAITSWKGRFEDEQVGLWLWGEAHLLSGRYAEARDLLRECAVRYREGEGWVYLGRMLPILGAAHVHLGEYEQAREATQEAVVLNRESLSYLPLGLALAVRGDVELVMGQETAALELFQQAAGVSREREERKRLADALAHRAYVARRLGQGREAQRNVSEAIHLGCEIRSLLPLWAALPACALLLADRGELERAAELYGLAWSVPHVARSQWYEDVAGRELAAVSEGLPLEVREAALERGRARDVVGTLRELLAELEREAAVYERR
jgi:tetratricopeptide (TPR) repeat protein